MLNRGWPAVYRPVDQIAPSLGSIPDLGFAVRARTQPGLPVRQNADRRLRLPEDRAPPCPKANMLRRLPRLFSPFSRPPFHPREAPATHAGQRDGAPAQASLLGASLHLAPGASFDQLQARQILLGAGPLPVPTEAQVSERWQPPCGARPWGLRGWQIGHSLNIAQAQRVPCALAVRGQLNVLGHCAMEGDIRVRNGLRLGPGCSVHGDLFSEGDIHIDPDCCVHGMVMAEGKLHLSPGVVIGTPRLPVSVCADVIEVVGPVLIHGSVHARIQGAIALMSLLPDLRLLNTPHQDRP